MPEANGNRIRAVEMLQHGQSITEVSTALGLSPNTVSSYGTWGRKKGLLTARPSGRRRNVHGGGSLWERLPPEVTAWVRAMVEAAPGTVFHDHIAAIVTDAYHEEQNGEP
jgi:hypothetical protein